jgi:hypothetical protein
VVTNERETENWSQFFFGENMFGGVWFGVTFRCNGLAMTMENRLGSGSCKITSGILDECALSVHVGVAYPGLRVEVIWASMGIWLFDIVR